MPDLPPPTLLVSYVVLAFAVIALGAPPLLRRVPRTPQAIGAITGAVAAAYVLATLRTFDPYWTALVAAAVAGPAIFLTIALPEELFFRCVLQGGLEKRWGRPLPALIVASLAFGLMHWNNVDSLKFRIEYCTLATIGGAIYGIAYRYGGS